MGKKIEWSPTRIDTANYCTMKYYLKYVERAPDIQLSAFLKGSLLHELIQNFWKRVNIKYSTPKEFASYSQGKWMQYCIRSENSNRPVSWRFENERWVIKKDLEGICMTLFPILQEEGPPIFSELGFKLKIAGKTFTGRIDEVRRRLIEGIQTIVIRDYKSGKPFIGEMKLNFDPQLTVYNAGFNALLSESDEIARKLGFDGRVINADGLFINSDIVQEFFMLEAPYFVKRREEEGKIVTMPYLRLARRTNEHFIEVINMINGAEKAIATGNVYPEWGRKCEDCNMKDACKARFGQSDKPYSSAKGQLFLDFAIPMFAKPEVRTMRDKTQKTLPLRTKRKVTEQLVITPSLPSLSS